MRRATRRSVKLFHQNYISIHALLAESDPLLTFWLYRLFRFLSTLSLRRATTRRTCHKDENQEFLSTLSLRRATVHYDNYNLHCVISIHALLAESDHNSQPRPDYYQQFLSTLSLRRATVKYGLFFFGRRFLSTLSLRRATSANCSCRSARPDFYPRSPCGERQNISWLDIA